MVKLAQAAKASIQRLADYRASGNLAIHALRLSSRTDVTEAT
jgi:hypothetical protein